MDRKFAIHGENGISRLIAKDGDKISAYTIDFRRYNADLRFHMFYPYSDYIDESSYVDKYKLTPSCIGIFKKHFNDGKNTSDPLVQYDFEKCFKTATKQ